MCLSRGMTTTVKENEQAAPPVEKLCIDPVAPAPQPTAGLSPRGPKLRSETVFHRTMALLAAFFLLVSLVGLPLARIDLVPAPLVARGFLLVFLLLGIFFYRWRQVTRITNLLIIVTWSILFGTLYVFPEYAVARCGFPVRDAWFAGIDRSLGLEVPAILQCMASLPAVNSFLKVSYDSLLLFYIMAIMLPPFCGHMGRAKELAVASLAAAVISIPISAVLPAMGPWDYYGYAATPEQEKITTILSGLRGDGRYLLNFSQMEGIITFPSFHTILAILSAFALWPLRPLRWPAVICATLTVISTLTTGWHYLIDVLGGVVVTLLACLLARGYSRLESRLAQPAD
jgi:hypothetical protein